MFFVTALSLSVLATGIFFGRIFLGDFRGVVLSIIGVFFFYIFSIAIYRLFFFLLPLHAGEIKEGSREEFLYHIYLLFFLMIFKPVMRSGFVPVPIMRVFYIALGAKLGPNTYSGGIIEDPLFTQIGENSLVGQSALLGAHVIENRTLAHYPITIGSNVTIGAQSVILADVIIGDNAIVAAGSVVTKGTRIGEGEVWGGVPAKFLKRNAIEGGNNR